MKNRFKKISTITSCFLVIVMFISLCATAYYNYTSEVISGNYTFANVKIETTVELETKAPINISQGEYDKNAYYFTLERAVEETRIKYDARITNTGEKDILAMLVIAVPSYDVKTDVISLPFTDYNNEDWYWIGGDSLGNSVGRYYILGYRKPLKPGETTTSPFEYIISNPMKLPYNNSVHYPNNAGYTEFVVQNFAIGVQTMHDSLIDFNEPQSTPLPQPKTVEFDRYLTNVFRTAVEPETNFFFVDYFCKKVDENIDESHINDT